MRGRAHALLLGLVSSDHLRVNPRQNSKQKSASNLPARPGSAILRYVAHPTHSPFPIAPRAAASVYLLSLLRT
ncbi:hypothetical protein RRG08_017108 [Elysia crispata]|uniref:Uncharacterized protein n=1 Tax=Elysia crispata TaxID=231223 RepID=A0AAE0ZPF1_9GAST|nr:hypothetical protein RRG08_017108 [Elysia crispata]